MSFQHLCLNTYRKQVNKNIFDSGYVQWEHFLVFYFILAKY